MFGFFSKAKREKAAREARKQVLMDEMLESLRNLEADYEECPTPRMKDIVQRARIQVAFCDFIGYES